MKRCGYWISEQKMQKMKFGEVVQEGRKRNIELIKINFDLPVQDQGPFELLLHKFTDNFGLAEEGSESTDHLKNLENYTRLHPEVPVLNPLPRVKRLLDRHRQYQIVSSSPLISKEGEKFMIPSFVDFPSSSEEDNKSRMKEFGLTYPILCKPKLAHGPALCHQMTLIFNDQGLKDVSPPCVAQTFVPHGARLFKLYVLGDAFAVVERPSLKNFKAGDQESIFFNSHDVSKPKSSGPLTELDEEDKGSVVEAPCLEDMKKISEGMREAFGLQLLGVDVIIDAKTGKHGIIDVNAFPGYEGVSNFPAMFCTLIEQTLEEKQRLLTQTESERSSTVEKNGASTLQNEQNGSDIDGLLHSNGYSSDSQPKHKQGEGDQDIPAKVCKTSDEVLDVHTREPVKSGPGSISPDH